MGNIQPAFIPVFRKMLGVVSVTLMASIKKIMENNSLVPSLPSVALIILSPPLSALL